MRPSLRMRLKHSAGFSLVELMVGMVIGMFGIIVMMQVFALSEERKRTTTGGGDAMTEGVMAMYTLQRDIRQGGYGVAAFGMFGCTVTVPAAPGVNIPFAPVTINPAATVIPLGDANTDTLLVIYGNPDGEPQGQTGSVTLPSPTYYVRSSPCNPSPITISPAASTTLAVADTLYVLGTSPKILAYAIRAGNLTVCDYTAANCGTPCTAADNTCNANWLPIANNVVSLRVQYGRDTLTVVPASLPDPLPGYIVDTYDQNTPAGAALAVSCGWTRTGAIRLALVARSAQFEKDIVTNVAPVWDGSAGAPIDLTKKPDGTANANWGNYRYKLFQTVVPIRNVAWMGWQSGC